ncbi:sensor histidine kinase [Mucilaginibacter polytrichastri]|uniref:Oxygen sensor histidine kinase NreB n=1 Tax=Mucilaginibacter polytrichastri TaxID=1302689 RepID=A0A1Q6A3T3_9SPHI|nr:ATP-binding protein [Mucilaginibacter polytrichastri]OKS88663.1 hypothetical protein RG47T_4135 [Mucilaginibacter polytrichastri]SFT26528.1 Histidine kinase [Mucilaginibacter polytrichastri]
MFNTQQELFYIVGIVSAFFILLIAIIIFTALLYHSNKRLHQAEVASFQNVLIQAQLEAQEQTMQTIGADLHDNIGQLLSLTSLTLGSIELNDAKRMALKIDAAIDLTNRSIKELRELGKLIQGQKLLEMGLSQAIIQEVNWLEKAGQYQITYNSDDIYLRTIKTDKDLIIFRVLQETLNNIIKHAEANQIAIKLSLNDGILQLVVADNGKGFNTSELASSSKGMGLFNIYKRVNAIGGHSNIRSIPNEGSTIEIYIPYP